MAKFKAYDYRQRVLLPVCLEDQLLPGTLEFAIHTLVETRLDTSGFQQHMIATKVPGQQLIFRTNWQQHPLPIIML